MKDGAWSGPTQMVRGIEQGEKKSICKYDLVPAKAYVSETWQDKIQQVWMYVKQIVLWQQRGNLVATDRSNAGAILTYFWCFMSAYLRE